MSIIGKNIIKHFGEPPVRVLHGLDFEIADGEFVSISGRSGSGKSTLLYIISTLDDASEGELLIDGRDYSKLDASEVHSFRNEQVGFIFQFHYLLEELTALENILLPARNLGREVELRDRALELMERFEIGNKADSFPKQMSGGEQQRVAIARALLLKPRYIFADEPTGNLDSHNALKVMETLRQVNVEMGTTVLLVTHEEDFSKMADREILLRDGYIVDERQEIKL